MCLFKEIADKQTIVLYLGENKETKTLTFLLVQVED